jgi:PAS domain S-box-containing protein
LAAALFANVTTAGTVLTGATIALGNMLEALLIAFLVRRWCGGLNTFDTPGRVVTFAAICGLSGTLVSATIGVTALAAAGLASWSDFAKVWTTWWLGDLAGALVVAPLVILWAKPATLDEHRAAAPLYLATAAVGLIAFGPLIHPTTYTMPLSFVAVLPLLWAGLRYGRRETMTVAVLLSGFALWGVVGGAGPFGARTENESMLRLIAFMIATTVPSLALAAEVDVRRQVEADLRGRQQDLRAMFDQALVGIVETDPRGVIVSANDRFCDIMGRRAVDIIGHRMQEFTDPEDLTRDDAQFRNVASKGGGFSVDKRYLRPDGTTVWVRNTVSAIADGEGRVVRLVAVSEDVTERRRLRGELERRVAQSTDALAMTEHNLRLLVESVTDYAIYMIDPEGRVASWNAGAERIKGYSAAEIIGRHFSIFYTEAERLAGEPERALAMAVERGRFEGQGWRVRKDGTRFFADTLIHAVRDQSGALVGFSKVTRDITERRRAAEALDEARDQLFQAQKLEAVGQLTGGVAHDFNNILAVILSGVSLIERHLDDETRVRHVLGLLRQTAHRGEGLIKQLLAFSRRGPTRVQSIDVAARLRETFDLIDRLLGETVEVHFDIAPDLGYIQVDPSQFDLAILNICLNARDAMPNGGSITVSARNERGDRGARVAIAIADTGEGMTAEIKARAFEPFFTTKDVGKGSGLGLSQAYGFAQGSGGEIELESEVGRGTTVTLRLPATTARPRAAPGPGPAVPAVADRRAVLVIEDDASLAVVTEALLEDGGYAVTLAHNAAEALARLRGGLARTVVAVFSDVVMPGGMNGFDLARVVRREFPGLPILLTSGYSGAVAASEIEGVRVLAKPYEPEELFAALDTLIAESRGARAQV